MQLEPYKPPFIIKEIKIEVTQRCPLACVHCSSLSTPESKIEINVDKGINIARQIEYLNINNISISGGEPLVWSGLFDFIIALSKHNPNITIYTSGNVDNFSETSKKLKNLGVKRVIFSLYASSPNVHEQITRIKDSFQKTIKSIKIAKLLGFLVELHFVPLRCNFLELPSVIELAKFLRLDGISLLRFVPQGRGQLIPHQSLTKYENLYLKKLIERPTNTMDLRLGSPYNFLLINDSPKCTAAIERLFIGPDLEIYPCDAFKQIKSIDIVGSSDFSNLNQNDISHCWEKSPYLNKVRDYLTSPFESPCLKCHFLIKCLSGCLAQKVIRNRSFKKDRDPLCLIG